MQCSECQGLLSDYLDGDVSDVDRRSIDAHMRDCSRCATVRNDLARIIHASASLPAQTPSSRVWEGIHREIAGGSSVVAGPKAWWRQAGERRFEVSVSMRQLLAAAAGIVVVAGAFLFVRGTGVGAGVPVGSTTGIVRPEGPSTVLSNLEGVEELRQLTTNVDDMSKEIAKREPAWSPELRDTFHKSLAEIDAKVDACQATYAATGTDSTRRPLVEALRAKFTTLEEFARAAAAPQPAKK